MPGPIATPNPPTPPNLPTPSNTEQLLEVLPTSPVEKAVSLTLPVVPFHILPIHTHTTTDKEENQNPIL